ncbi:N-acetylmuramoyl-L-alanine amidase [Edaphobacillus lindanitolerans]|uniref:N-acetylmuramoyl-L-alanine amidase n=1 Tax=Edaphobacillus lindanitolerans TaxID=550447 RepID=A0A1U7PNN0_9BACI|nr:N-acetylmuramoyl-L-alanine amidase [Edaphobacillus lindanitolerans]SIT73518.1 N-acetylmuramoyl-L-alanine amidase [Edaphobacillus lindanitolerans]
MKNTKLSRKIIALTVAFSLSAPLVPLAASPSKIMVDPGHGGSDSGALGYGLYEKDLNLKLSRLVNEKLNKSYIVETRMTRNSDVFISLNGRTDMANAWGADLFVSIHHNSSGGSGYEDYIHTTNTTEKDREVQREINKEVQRVLSQYGLNNRGEKKANFHVLRESDMPSILLEILFVDHPGDAAHLKNNQFMNDMASAITLGVAQAMDLSLKENATPPTIGGGVDQTGDIRVQKMSGTFESTTDSLNVRSGNTTQYRSLGKLNKGDRIEVTGITSNGWYQFSFKGNTAYVSGDYLKRIDSAPPTPPANGGLLYGKVLSLGQTGSHVKQWQQDMNKVGFKMDVDGSYGPASRQKAIEFQKKYKLEADGYFGPSSQAKMASLLKGASNPAPSDPKPSDPKPPSNGLIYGKVLSLGQTGSHVKQWQQDMNKVGFKMDVDGSYGPASRQKAIEFQKKYKLEADGYFGPSSQAKMASLLKGASNPAPSDPKPSDPKPPSNGLIYGKVLSLGQTGSHVKQWQQDMNKVGFKMDVDGSYGPASRQKAIEFQKKYKLEADGYFGPSSQAKMASLLGGATAPSNPKPSDPKPTVPSNGLIYGKVLSFGQTGAHIKQWQQDMNKVGFKMDVDGSYGPSSRQKAIEFQKKYKLEADGYFGPASQAKMASLLK